MNQSTTQKVNLVTLRMRHHAGHSGYDRLVEFLPGNVCVTPEKFSIQQRVLQKLFYKMYTRSGVKWYKRGNFITEYAMALKWMRRKNQIFHFLYGENSYRYLGALKGFSRNNRIVCTYHTPLWRFNELISTKKHLKKLDAIILVSSEQRNKFAEIVGEDRAFYVPHGIDTEYYVPAIKPAGRKDASFRCICVGHHLRDFDVLFNVAERLVNLGSDFKIQVVARPESKGNFGRLPNVEYLSGVSDSHLLRLYQNADALVLPLRDATANNALLEGTACGLPVISTDIQGVKDYTNEASRILTPKGDVNGIVNAIRAISEDDELRSKMAKASRESALRFRWENVARQVLDVYENLA